MTCTDYNECLGQNGGNDCNTNAFCLNTPGSYTCTCDPTYVGNGVLCYVKPFPIPSIIDTYSTVVTWNKFSAATGYTIALVAVGVHFLPPSPFWKISKITSHNLSSFLSSFLSSLAGSNSVEHCLCIGQFRHLLWLECLLCVHHGANQLCCWEQWQHHRNNDHHARTGHCDSSGVNHL